jgi:hypothetical protein
MCIKILYVDYTTKPQLAATVASTAPDVRWVVIVFYTKRPTPAMKRVSVCCECLRVLTFAASSF